MKKINYIEIEALVDIRVNFGVGEFFLWKGAVATVQKEWFDVLKEQGKALEVKKK